MSQNGNGPALALDVPLALVEAIAQRTAEILAEQLPDRSDNYLNTEQAAAYIAAPVSRIYDLCRDGRLHPLKDGSRSLFTREQLDAVLTRSDP